MFKRFVIGFLVGVGLMYFYIQRGEKTLIDATRWFDQSAHRYRGDQHHQSAEDVSGGRRP